ncbi:hypothetical protein F4802DRAFT_610840 [Xylaria palmicola]|nr:hypothetical protein F4802DRAFT_610840 [Xylaria palmicola]
MAPGPGSRTKKQIVYCEGSPSWTPDAYLADTALHARAEAHLANDNLQAAITTSFGLRGTDTYVYHAMVAVTLPQVQQVVALGDAHGLHSWYYSEPATDSSPQSPPPPPPPPPPTLLPFDRALPPPPRSDIEAYLSLFDPSNAPDTALRNFTSNAKKGSLRREIGTYLTSKRYIHPSLATALKVPRTKPSRPPPANPYLAFLAWAARGLEWAGPGPSSAAQRRPGPTSHHVLPVLMHHFGCACPSHEALEVLRRLADGREIIDVGSGNGYWTRMLRDYHASHAAVGTAPAKSDKEKPLPAVTPVDSAQSSWRATWVRDTVVSDGATYLRSARAGAPDAVLLLVYPIVGGGVAGGTPGGFTRGALAAYAGDTLAVVGAQDRSGYTGFPDATMDEFMAREHGAEWVRVAQVPLPSFPGKDEALYVFQRGARAPPPVDGEAGGP